MCSVVARGRGRSGVEHSTNDPSFSDKSFFTKGLFFITYPTTGTYSVGHLAKDPFVASAAAGVFGCAHSLVDSFKDPAVPIVGITSVDHFTAASCEGTVTARFTIGTYFGEHVKYCIKDSHRVTVIDFHKVTVICTGPFVEDSSVGPVTALTCTGYFVKDSFAAGLPTVTDFAVHVAKNLPR